MPDGLSVYRSDRPHAALVLAHGAGAGRLSRFMVEAARELAGRGVTTVTFDFPYIRQGRKLPDKGPVLEQSWREVIAHASNLEEIRTLPLFAGGKSMGGRMASHVIAQDPGTIRGLVFFGYPLHPLGKPDRRRDAHLPAVTIPMLFLQGSRDDLGTAAEIRELLPRLNSAAELYEAAGADHSFRRARMPDLFDAAVDFIRRCAN